MHHYHYQNKSSGRHINKSVKEDGKCQFYHKKLCMYWYLQAILLIGWGFFTIRTRHHAEMFYYTE
jgi:hypothetical protein